MTQREDQTGYIHVITTMAMRELFKSLKSACVNHTAGTHRDDQVGIYLLLSLFRPSVISTAVQQPANLGKSCVWSMLSAGAPVPYSSHETFKSCFESLYLTLVTYSRDIFKPLLYDTPSDNQLDVCDGMGSCTVG